jgi:putative DNA primase/helicase
MRIFDEQFIRVAEFALEPSINVKTKKSLHCYWLLKNGDIKPLFETFSGG